MNETTMNETTAELVDAIVAHQNKHGIVSMFKKGPPIGKDLCGVTKTITHTGLRKSPMDLLLYEIWF